MRLLFMLLTCPVRVTLHNMDGSDCVKCQNVEDTIKELSKSLSLCSNIFITMT
jgi:hypothetical protein